MKRIGFTLVELLVVMVIILILAGIGLKHLAGAKTKAKNTQVSANVHDIQVALEQYAIDHNRFYPGLNWEIDANGVVTGVAPAVLGGVESGAGENDFQSWIGKNPPAYLADGTPRANYIDLLVGTYLKDYPANPFITATAGTRSQMTNLMWYVPDTGNGQFQYLDEQSVDWNRLTDRSGGDTMKTLYDSKGRGHFSYLPLGPVNNQGLDFSQSNWSNLSDSQRAQMYKYSRSYLLIGWGASRMDTSVSKGFSANFYDPSLGGFDINKDLKIDAFEANLATFLRPEQIDSSGNAPTNFGQLVAGNLVDVDDAFAGAVIILTP